MSEDAAESLLRSFREEIARGVSSRADYERLKGRWLGREMARRENGQRVLDRLLVDLTGKAIAESRSEMLGNRLYQILSPVKHEKAGTKAAG